MMPRLIIILWRKLRRKFNKNKRHSSTLLLLLALLFTVASAALRKLISDLNTTSITVNGTQFDSNGYNVTASSDVTVNSSGTIDATHVLAGNAGKPSLF